MLLSLTILVPFGLFLLAKAGLRYDVKKCKRGENYGSFCNASQPS